MREQDQERVLTEAVARIATRAAETHHAGKKRFDETLADSVYYEKLRLKGEKKSSRQKEDKAFWGRAQRRLSGASEKQQQRMIERAAHRYLEEISGNFDERVYKAVTRAGVPALGLLLNAVSPSRLLQRFPEMPSLDDAMIVQGETEKLRRLRELGTVILVPTHVSNLDSIVMGYALYRLGLPPFIYGAGLNLFSNPIMGFFMHNLGAYTVDRRKKDPLYKEALKEYATLTLEHGYDNIFFPGGTRSRSGATEKRLKLGLLGTGVRAYTQNLMRGAKNPKVFIVPATLSFQLVLEAETLIDDFLKEQGKSRYIITDDEFAKPKRIYDFAKQLMSLDSKIYVTFSKPLDPFGNDVGENGESLDPQGREIDPARYVFTDHEPTVNAKREALYTQRVGERIADAFARDSVIQATHLTAWALFQRLRAQNPNTDLIRLLRSGGPREDVALADLYQDSADLLLELRKRASDDRIRLSPLLSEGRIEDIVDDALKHFAIYHDEPAAVRRGDRVFATQRSLLFYYQNRLEGYGLEKGLPPCLSADRRSLSENA